MNAPSRNTVEELVVVLVDYDNLARAIGGRGNVAAALGPLVKTVHGSVRAVFASDIGRLSIRLYGGWIDSHGSYTPVAQRIMADLRYYRGRREGAIVDVSLAFTLQRIAQIRLIGTSRGSGKKTRQKMVDGMMMMDTLHHVAQDEPVVLMSDDDDLVPGALVAGLSSRRPVIWLRRRARPGMNDVGLSECNVSCGTTLVEPT